MSAIIRTWRLANGLKIEAEDDTVNYYGDYHNVRLSIRCAVAVKPEYLKASKGSPQYDRATALLGPVAEYCRKIVKTGVPARDASEVKEYMLRKFEENALPYLEREVFPERFVQKRFTEISEELSRKGRSHNDNNGD